VLTQNCTQRERFKAGGIAVVIKHGLINFPSSAAFSKTYYATTLSSPDIDSDFDGIVLVVIRKEKKKKS
jgi:hypothetical protein